MIHGPRFIECGDPLQDEDRLLHRRCITDEEDAEGLTTLTRSASNQMPGKCKWDSKRRTAGRSKTGLHISVPFREDTTRSVSGPSITENLLDKSIIYNYDSLSTEQSRIASSFGAVGDHRPPDEGAPSSHGSPDGPEDAPNRLRERPNWDEGHRSQTPLRKMVEASVPDKDMYDLFIARKMGLLLQQTDPLLVKASDFQTMLRQ